jgi:5-methyltetrahydropteroyltriglutamate--homocysteine methyltransferase
VATSFMTTVPGYPRVGPGRTYKRVLEERWSGATTPAEFVRRVAQLRRERLRTQRDLGLDLVPCGDFSLYDHVLDAAIMLGCLPARFGWSGGQVDAELYFAMARGRAGAAACELTKWFDTNYHYLVPELPARFALTSNWPLDALRVGRRVVGSAAKPVVLGPFSFLRLARLDGRELARRLLELLPIYRTILDELIAAGATLIQVDEPALVGDLSDEEWSAFAGAYRALAGEAVVLQTYYGDVGPRLADLAALPVGGIGLDLVRGRAGNLAALERHGFPADKRLVAGVVDGRNVWRSDLDDLHGLVERLAERVAPERLLLSASCPLLHLPETVATEGDLPETLRGGLCFAQERVGELRLLAGALRSGRAAVAAEWEAAQAALRAFRAHPARRREEVRQRVAALSEADATRPPYPERSARQRARLGLPPLPTTTIGSFPQTPDLRRARARAGQDPAGYAAAVEAEIARVVRLQEEVGLDVLVHGEPERSDMVQFFAEQLDGFASTQHGWVQSYGSRCVRPPLLHGDVARRGPMTVRETVLAQSLTGRPVKGMLTGPITMLQWSFARADLPAEQVAGQLALAVRDEAADLEAAGIGVIQVDEPAFREGLPLRRADWDGYLGWAVRAFRVATSGVRPDTQVHTHMCYAEFGDVLASIAALDADVLSIEDARSDGATLRRLRDFRYGQEIGPGVYDVHSPEVPTVELIVEKIRASLTCLPAERVWVNPDCGLKTRRYAEVVPALRAMVEAARRVRTTLAGG